MKDTYFALWNHTGGLHAFACAGECKASHELLRAAIDEIERLIRLIDERV